MHPKHLPCVVSLIWTHTVLHECRVLFKGIYAKSLESRSASLCVAVARKLMRWQRENTLTAIKGQGLTRPPRAQELPRNCCCFIIHQISPEKINQRSLSRAFNPHKLWVKVSTMCQLRLTPNLSQRLTNTCTVRWCSQKTTSLSILHPSFYRYSLGWVLQFPFKLAPFPPNEIQVSGLVTSPLRSEIWTVSQRALSTLSTERWSQSCWVICLSGTFTILRHKDIVVQLRW